MLALRNKKQLNFNEIFIKGEFITEKFALLNLIKALGGLNVGQNESSSQPSNTTPSSSFSNNHPNSQQSGKQNQQQNGNSCANQQVSNNATTSESANLFAAVIERHNALSNKIKHQK
jgi:hypothetical protein